VNVISKKFFDEIKKDFEKADILFLTPNQIELLPPQIVDLTVNISSFHEMRLDQIKYYFRQIERLTRSKGYLYLKEWKKSYNPYDDIFISVNNYPVAQRWKEIYLREAKIQTKFFEELLQLKN
jgi:hypothetical protein